MPCGLMTLVLTVEVVAVARLIRRTRLLPRSCEHASEGDTDHAAGLKLSAGEARTATTAKVPLRSIAMSQGRLNWASVPTPSWRPAEPVPANVVAAPVSRLTLRIRWLLRSCDASWEGHAERGAINAVQWRALPHRGEPCYWQAIAGWRRVGGAG